MLILFVVGTKVFRDDCCIRIINIFLRMFQKLLDNPQLPPKQQKQVLKSVLTHNLKHNIHEVKLQFNHNYPALKPILLLHAKYAMRLALALHTWQIAHQSLTGKRENAAADLLHSSVLVQPGSNGLYLLVDLAKTFQDHWRLLAILKLVSEEAARGIRPEDFGSFLATYVKISASVITTYLQTKNEPTQFNTDRIQSDLHFVNNCETWVSDSYIKMIDNLRGPQTREQRQVVLAAFSQIIGALLQNQYGGGQLAGDKLREIEVAARNYMFRHFSLKQVGDMFASQYAEGNYKARLKKIQIPEKYESTTEYAKEGICWLIQQWVDASPAVYSDQFILFWELVAFSQSLESALPIKSQLLEDIKKKIGKGVNWGSFEQNYPLGLFLFNIFAHKKQELEFFKEKVGFGQDVAADVRRFRRLLSIDLGQHYVEQVGLIVHSLTEKHIKDKQMLLLAKAIKFSFSSEDLLNSVCSLIESVVHNHGEGRKVVTWLVERERDCRRNIELCVKIEHKLNI